MRRKSKNLVVAYSAGPFTRLHARLHKVSGIVKVGAFVLASVVVAVSLYALLLQTSTIWMSFIALVLCLGFSAFGVLFFSRDEIIIADKGVEFPLLLSVPLQFRTVRLWSDISKVDVLVDGTDASSIRSGAAAIEIAFYSGGSVRLQLSKFRGDSINSFVAALEEWASRCTRNKRLGQLPKLFELESAPERDSRSYTEFWEEQLKDSYTFTAFVPLTQDQKLRSETLTIIRHIASGGFSAVYLVSDAEGNKFVVKESVVPEHLDANHRNKVKEHFQREASILVKLSHPNVARVYDHFVENGRDYLLIEYIEGSDAREVVRKTGSVDVEKVIDWAADIADVLEYLHNQSPPVLHRDVSPDNLVLKSDGTMILIDFGAANEYVGQATGTLVGKQSYMPPEQVRGKCSTQSDIYGFGATLYYLLVGKDPEPLSCSSPKTVRADVPEAMDTLVSLATKLEESERFASINDLKQELERIRPLVAGVRER